MPKTLEINMKKKINNKYPKNICFLINMLLFNSLFSSDTRNIKKYLKAILPLSMNILESVTIKDNKIRLINCINETFA